MVGKMKEKRSNNGKVLLTPANRVFNIFNTPNVDNSVSEVLEVGNCLKIQPFSTNCFQHFQQVGMLKTCFARLTGFSLGKEFGSIRGVFYRDKKE